MSDASRARGKRLVPIAGIVAALAQCPAQSWGEGWAVLAYFSGGGELARDVQAHGAALIETPTSAAVALQTRTWTPDGLETVQRWRREPSGSDAGAIGPTHVSAGEATDLAGFISWAAPLIENRQCLLAVMAHGTPPQGGGVGRAGAWRLWGARDGRAVGLSARDLAEAVTDGLAQVKRRQVDILVVESCFSAGVEVLSELARCARFAVAVPGEIASPGLAWDDIALRLNEAAECSAEGLVGHVLSSAVAGAGSMGSVPWSLTACDLTQLSATEKALRAVSLAALSDVESFARAAHWAEAQAAPGDRLQQACDLGDLARALTAHARNDSLRAGAERLHLALDDVVIGRSVLGSMSEYARRRTEHRAGVTVFLPPVTSRTVTEYARENALPRQTGYGRLLERYLNYCGALSPFLP